MYFFSLKQYSFKRRSLYNLRFFHQQRVLSTITFFSVISFVAPFFVDVFAGATEPVAQVESTSSAEPRDLFADTWVAVDALGRKTPTFEEVGPVKADRPRTVGIFYITWHTQNLKNLPQPYSSDVTKILTEAPEARLDANHPAWKNAGSFHWGEPERGYFLSQDEYVIRKDMSELTDAGIDVIILDVTNAVLYWDEWEVLFKTMEKIKAEGNPVPKFCFWSFNGESISIVQQLYEAFYKTRKYEDLWFYWDGKPLLLYNSTPEVDANRAGIKSRNLHYDHAAKNDPNNPNYGDPEYTEEFYLDYTNDVKNFFTLRTMWWGYYQWNGKRFIGTEDNWSFGYDLSDKKVRDMDPDALLSRHEGEPEQAAVTPAQHPSSLVGKSWSRAKGEPELDERDMPVPTFVPWLGRTVSNPEGYGIYYQERWDEALASDPRFIYINDWNEWTAGKYQTPEPLAAMNFMRRGADASYFFVDQYNAEFNRCVQPMHGGYVDNYYMQTVQNIRRYKGARPIPTNVGEIHVDAAGPLAAWSQIAVEYRDTIGDVAWRDALGYAGDRYIDQTGRNDFLTCKVGVDATNLYFFAETANEWTPSTDPNWALLFIDSDQNSETGWFGYDFLVNKNVVDETQTTLCCWTPDVDTTDPRRDGTWKEIARPTYLVEKNRLAITIPRETLNATDSTIAFDFKWSDNTTDLADPISLCVAGDSAPNRRFNYRFQWKSNDTDSSSSQSDAK